MHALHTGLGRAVPCRVFGHPGRAGQVGPRRAWRSPVWEQLWVKCLLLRDPIGWFFSFWPFLVLFGRFFRLIIPSKNKTWLNMIFIFFVCFSSKAHRWTMTENTPTKSPSSNNLRVGRQELKHSRPSDKNDVRPACRYKAEYVLGPSGVLILRK